MASCRFCRPLYRSEVRLFSSLLPCGHRSTGLAQQGGNSGRQGGDRGKIRGSGGKNRSGHGSVRSHATNAFYVCTFAVRSQLPLEINH